MRCRLISNFECVRMQGKSLKDSEMDMETNANNVNCNSLLVWEGGFFEISSNECLLEPK